MKQFYLIATALVFLCMNSCSYQVTRDASVLVQSIANDPASLNPLLAPSEDAAAIYSRVYEKLAYRDLDTLELKPQLATHWEISADKLTYIFYLRKGVHWHDGVPFTADDIIFTYERIKDPQVDASRLRSYYRNVEKLEKIDDYTVRFTYKKPYFKALAILGGMWILPEHIFTSDQDFNKHPANRAPIGTGPFKFSAWKTGRKISIERNENYWGDKPALSSFVVKIIPNPIVSFALLKKGGLDADALTPIQWSRQTNSAVFQERFHKVSFYRPKFSYIAWNLRKPYFADKRVRKALTMLLDRKNFLKQQLLGEGEVVTGAAYRFGPDYDASIEALPYNSAMAIKLLEEAGWVDSDGDGIRDKAGVPFRFTYIFRAGSNASKSIGLFFRESLAKVGIDMNVEQFEWATLYKMLRERSFDAVSLAWVLPVDYDPFSMWHSSAAAQGVNLTGFKSPQVDDILEQAQVEFDHVKRSQLYYKLHRIISEEQPYTFLFTTPQYAAVSKRFDNVVLHKLGLDSNDWQLADAAPLISW